MRQPVVLGILGALATLLGTHVLGASPSDLPPPGKHCKLKPGVHAKAPTFKSGQPIVGTTYFYWYDVYTGAHIRNVDGSDAMTTHPPESSTMRVLVS
jgi:hypothetical protein